MIVGFTWVARCNKTAVLVEDEAVWDTTDMMLVHQVLDVTACVDGNVVFRHLRHLRFEGCNSVLLLCRDSDDVDIRELLGELSHVRNLGSAWWAPCSKALNHAGTTVVVTELVDILKAREVDRRHMYEVEDRFDFDLLTAET